MEILMFVVFVFWIGSAFAGEYVARQKGREVKEGAILGLAFGPIGVLIEACLPVIYPGIVKETSRMMPHSSKS